MSRFAVLHNTVPSFMRIEDADQVVVLDSVVEASVEDVIGQNQVRITHPAFLMEDDDHAYTILTKELWESESKTKLILTSFYNTIVMYYGRFKGCKHNYVLDRYMEREACIKHMTLDLDLWPNWEKEI